MRSRTGAEFTKVDMSVLSDCELIEVLLDGTTSRTDIGALVAGLMCRYGSLTTLARARAAHLVHVPGIGQAEAVTLTAAFELARRVRTGDEKPPVTDTGILAAAVRPLLTQRERERVVLIALDQRNRITATEIIAEGAADRCPIPIREAIVAALRYDARAIALAHNHPGGHPNPSREDIEATRKLAKAAATVGLRFLDHIILTDDTWRRIPSGTRREAKNEMAGRGKRTS